MSEQSQPITYEMLTQMAGRPVFIEKIIAPIGGDASEVLMPGRYGRVREVFSDTGAVAVDTFGDTVFFFNDGEIAQAGVREVSLDEEIEDAQRPPERKRIPDTDDPRLTRRPYS